MKTYKVVKTNNDEIVGEFGTLDEAVNCIAQLVKTEAYELYETDEIDKYAIEDILFDNNNFIRQVMGYSHPDIESEYEIKEI